jgi:uncharacterized protein YggE
VTAYQKATLAILVAGIAVLAVALNARPAAIAATPVAVTSPTMQNAGITTSGEATIKVKPDIAVLSLGMTAESASAADAQAQVAQRVANVLKAAKDLGIADKDVKTYGYNLSPSYQPNNYPKIGGYTASEQISFTLRDVNKVGKALDALAGDAGATNASIQFALEDRKPAEAEARTQAIGEARSKAEAMAKAGGVRLGQLLAVSDQQSGYVGPIAYGAARTAGAADTVIPVGDLDVVIRVQVQYAIA